MQPSSTGVGEHVEDVALGLGGVEPLADVRGAERAVHLPVALPPRFDLVVRVRPPRRRLRRPRVVGSGGARAAASSERRDAADGDEEAPLPPVVRAESGRPRLEWDWELELPLQRQGHHRIGEQSRGGRLERERSVVAKYTSRGLG